MNVYVFVQYAQNDDFMYGQVARYKNVILTRFFRKRTE